jgi:hypothetical protein
MTSFFIVAWHLVPTASEHFPERAVSTHTRPDLHSNHTTFKAFHEVKYCTKQRTAKRNTIYKKTYRGRGIGVLLHSVSDSDRHLQPMTTKCATRTAHWHALLDWLFTKQPATPEIRREFPNHIALTLEMCMAARKLPKRLDGNKNDG